MTEQLERYLIHVENLNMDREQKLESLRPMYYIMKGFVERAFGLDPTQKAMGLQPFIPSYTDGNAVEFNSISKPKNQKKGSAALAPQVES